MSKKKDNNNLREIKIFFQITKSIVIDDSYSMGDINKICEEIFHPFGTDGFRLIIKDFEVTPLEKINVSNTLDYYKSNVIIVNPKELNASRIKNKKLNQDYFGYKESHERDNLNDIYNKLSLLKDSLCSTKPSSDSANKFIDKSNDFNNLSNKFKISDDQIDMAKSNALFSTKDFSIKDEKTKNNFYDSRFTNKLGFSIDKNSRNNFFSPSHENFQNNKKNQLFQSTQSFSSRGLSTGKIDQNLQTNKIENDTKIRSSLIKEEIIDKINKEIMTINILNSENIAKKEKLKHNLIKSQMMIKQLKNELENSISKQDLIEKLFKDSMNNSKNNKNKLVESPVKFIKPNLIDKINHNDKERIIQLEAHIKSLTDLNLNLQKSIKAYEEHTNDLQKTINVLQQSDELNRVTEENEKINYLCEMKNEEIMNLKKVIDELSKKWEEYETIKSKEKLRLLNKIAIENHKNENEHNEKINELELKLKDINEDYMIIKQQNEGYKELFQEKSKAVIEKKESFSIYNSSPVRLQIYSGSNLEFISKVFTRKAYYIIKESFFEICYIKSPNYIIKEISHQFMDNDFESRETLKQKIDGFKKILKKNEDFKSENEKKNIDINELKKKEKNLQELLAKKESESLNELNQKVILNETINQLRDSLNKKEQDLKLINDQTREIKQKLNENTNENQELKSKLLSIQTENKKILEKMSKEVLQLNNEISILTNQNNEFQRKSQKLEMEFIETNDKRKNVFEESKKLEKDLNEQKEKYEVKLKSLEMELKETAKKTEETKLTLLENNLKKVIEEKKSAEEKLITSEIKYNDLIKRKLEERKTLDKEITEIKQKLLEEKKTLDKEINELKQKLLEEKKRTQELQKGIDEEFKSLNLRKKDEKISLENDLKQYIEKLKESKLREENLKASLDKVNKAKETLIKVNDEQAKNLKEWENFPNKDQYLKIKEDYDRILKNSTKNDLLNRYNNLERKFIDLKNEFKHYLKKSNINSKNNLSKNINDLLNSSCSLEEENYVEEEDDKSTKKVVSIKEGTTFIFSVFDSKRILRYDLEYRSFKLLEFADYAEFEENFFPQGSIYLNISDGLLVVSGENHDLFYQYNYKKNCINKLTKLNDNHSYGGLVYYEKENLLICLSGWHNRRVEKYYNSEISFSFLNCTEGSIKNFNNNNNTNKNIWHNMPELKTERSECPYIIINNAYIYAFFGFNCPTMKYLESIERMNLEKQDTWEFVKFSNEEHLSTYIKSHSCIKYNDDEILFVGGYDGKNDNPVENFTFFNVKSNKFSGNQRKFPDILKNHCYYFQKHTNFLPFIEDQNKKHFASIDEKDNIHVLEIGSLQYDIFKFED